MGKLIVSKINKEEGSFEIPSNKGKLAKVSFLDDENGKKYFVIENENYASSSYLKKKVKALVKEEFDNEIFEVVLASFQKGDKIYSDPTNKYIPGTNITLQPDFKNYISSGVVECAAYTVRRPVKTIYEGNIQTTCKGGGLKKYSLFTVL